MNLLLDESIPVRLKNEFSGHDVVTVAEAGWTGKSNGELLQFASSSFDIFITADQNLEHQQNLDKFDLTVIIVVVAPTVLKTCNRWCRTFWLRSRKLEEKVVREVSSY